MRLIALALLMFSTAAIADEPLVKPSAGFIPFTVQESDINQLDLMMLNNAPRSYGQVVSDWLKGMETRARAEADSKQGILPSPKMIDPRLPKPPQPKAPEK